MRKRDALAVAVLIALGLSGCGAVSREATLVANYVPDPTSRVEVGRITNGTGQVPKVDDEVVDIEQLLKDALTEQLSGLDLLWGGHGARKLVLVSKIVEYEAGDAFKRWLMPGWGATVLSVECELRDGDAVVGTVRARRTVAAGGLYTVGAWRSIFASVADDIASEVRDKLRK